MPEPKRVRLKPRGLASRARFRERSCPRTAGLEQCGVPRRHAVARLFAHGPPHETLDTVDAMIHDVTRQVQLVEHVLPVQTFAAADVRTAFGLVAGRALSRRSPS